MMSSLRSRDQILRRAVLLHFAAPLKLSAVSHTGTIPTLLRALLLKINPKYTVHLL